VRAVDLNFASNPFRNNTPYYLGYTAAGALLLAFTLYNGYAFRTYSRGAAALEADQHKKRTQLEHYYGEAGKLQREIEKKDIKALNASADFTNGLLVRRRFSWTDLLNSLEEVQPYQVRLLSLRPIVMPRGILVDARAVAKDLQSFWNFQQNLQNHRKFRRVYPAGYLRSSELGEYIFNISFNYFPEGLQDSGEALSPAQLARERIVDAPGATEGDGSAEASADEEAVTEEPPQEAPAEPNAVPKSKAAPAEPGKKTAAQGAGAVTGKPTAAATARASGPAASPKPSATRMPPGAPPKPASSAAQTFPSPRPVPPAAAARQPAVFPQPAVPPPPPVKAEEVKKEEEKQPDPALDQKPDEKDSDSTEGDEKGDGQP
jgi:hypothetical protein